MSARMSGALIVGCLGALPFAGCSEVAAPPASAGAASTKLDEAPAPDHGGVADGGPPMDPSSLVGTYELAGPAGTAAADGKDVKRLVLLPDSTALACTEGASPCSPDDARTPRHPYALVASSDGTRQLVLRVSASDPAPFLVYPEASLSGQKLPCSELLYRDDDADHACAYYQCKLEVTGCSYFSDFGLPYCKKFFETRFDDADFAPRVRHCLEEAIRDQMDGMACAEVEQTAFQSHVACYVAGGFCSLSAEDKVRILDTIDVQDWNLANASTGLEIERSCAVGQAE